MPQANIEKHILKKALNAFANQTGIKLELVRGATKTTQLLLTTPTQAVKFIVMVMTDATIGFNVARMMAKTIKFTPDRLMVFPQITADMADELRQAGIQFIDTAGNGYINQPPLFAFIKGNKIKGFTKAPAVQRVFKQTGLRVLYTLLCNPGLENEPYRTIAMRTNVALGMVNWIVKDLNELGFLREMGTERRLIQKERLLERWITAYAEQLRPKLALGRYRGAEGWWQQAVLQPEQAQWGGEVAAAKLTEYLKPQTITIYVDKNNPAAILIPNRLKKDQDGDVELLGRFWQPDVIAPQGDTVHPLLVYADLMATGNQRNMETARIIYDEHIVQLIREN